MNVYRFPRHGTTGLQTRSQRVQCCEGKLISRSIVIKKSIFHIGELFSPPSKKYDNMTV